MFDIGWSEMAVIAVVAIVVIGPKDLPKVMRAVGQFTAKARGMAREFQNSMDDLAREADVADTKRDLERLATFDFKEEVEKNIDPAGDIKRSLEDVSSTAKSLDAPQMQTPISEHIAPTDNAELGKAKP